MFPIEYKNHLIIVFQIHFENIFSVLNPFNDTIQGFCGKSME